MRLIRWMPVVLALAAFGCGKASRLEGPPAAVDAARLRGASAGSAAAGAALARGAVYVASNSPSGNAVIAFARSSDGRLGSPANFATGGTGTGAGLGNQGGLVLSQNGRWLFVVNAGSNDVSSFRVSPAGLELAGRVPSGGVLPVSLAVHGGWLYVLNAGGAGNLQGFSIGDDGSLAAIAGSSRPLSSNAAAAAEVSFTPSGAQLVVTERATNAISVYQVLADGTTSGPATHASSGTTPFGFGFDPRGTLVVSEAFGGAALASAVSSYRLDGASLATITPSAATSQTAACWIAVTGNGRYAYASNAGSASITGYAIGADGALTRLDANGVTAAAGAGANELALSLDSRHLYVINGGAHSVGAYDVAADGSLEGLGAVGSLPAGANGIASR